MSVRDTSAFDLFTNEIVGTRSVTRKDEVQQYIRNVGEKYIRENLERVLLQWWERGVKVG